MNKTRTEERMDKLTVRMMKLKPDMMLILRNQHAIMLTLRNLTMKDSGITYQSSIPLLLYQIEQTDEAIGKGRAKDD